MWRYIRYKLFARKAERELAEQYNGLRESAIEWNITTLTENTLLMQIRKVAEEVNEVLDAIEHNPANIIPEKADVLISIWGLSAFNTKLGLVAEETFMKVNAITGDSMSDILNAAGEKLIELNQRTYVKQKGVYHHQKRTIN